MLEILVQCPLIVEEVKVVLYLRVETGPIKRTIQFGLEAASDAGVGGANTAGYSRFLLAGVALGTMNYCVGMLRSNSG